MSSRALRKLQRQREQSQETPASSNDEAHEIGASKPKFNAFDLLGAEEEEGEDEAKVEDDEEHVSDAGENAAITEAPVAEPPKPSLKSRKKKQKKKSKKPGGAATKSKPQTPTPTQHTSELDDIDRALQDLAIRKQSHNDDQLLPESIRQADEDEERLCALLAIEPARLSSINEMKSLFGNVVLETRQSEETVRPRARRRDRNRQAMDLGRALTGQFSPASRGQNLAGVAMRKNVLMQGKDEWPRAPSGGLGMEVVNKRASDVAEYKLVHNAAYKDVQFQFDICVESMEAQRMIELLQFNPYHLSTLLQVSEIAKHQGDHAVSADLLERALFNIGRSVHSSFGTRLKAGKARLDFNIKENRELWLCAWRYINSLGMKGTWKTAYEWSKLMLSLDPQDDPYCVFLLIDHPAIRGREYNNFVQLCTHPFFKEKWKRFPNIQCSLALAYFHLGRVEEAKDQLRFAITQFPWIFCRLAKELNIEPVPPQIWGVVPPSTNHNLLCELYVSRSKGVWNTPEIKALLIEAVKTTNVTGRIMAQPEMNQNIARHVMVSEINGAFAYLDRNYLNGPLSASDPLPPGGVEQEGSAETHASLLNAARQVFGFPGIGPGARDDDESSDNTEDDDPRFAIDIHDAFPDAVLGHHRRRQRQDDDEEEMENEEGDDDQITDPDTYLLNEGVAELRKFMQINGVDRGNWEDDTDITPLVRWVRSLRRLDRELWFGYMESAADALEAPMLMDLLLDELEEQGEEWVIEAYITRNS